MYLYHCTDTVVLCDVYCCCSQVRLRLRATHIVWILQQVCPQYVSFILSACNVYVPSPSFAFPIHQVSYFQSLVLSMKYPLIALLHVLFPMLCRFGVLHTKSRLCSTLAVLDSAFVHSWSSWCLEVLHIASSVIFLYTNSFSLHSIMGDRKSVV